ncbi:MAG: hemerythrin family protein [Clostridiaceae bacterium]|nr:hemerythrin family protein [Clostridiaceae bacterium]
MAIGWTPDLSVGVERIDDQHKIWFDKANQLFEAGKQGKSREYIVQMLDFLDDYTKQHFKDEEKYMNSIKYPQIDAQQKMHASFIEELDKLRKEYDASGGNVSLIINANQMIINWLTNHISSMDKKIGAYAKTL